MIGSYTNVNGVHLMGKYFLIALVIPLLMEI